MELETTLLPYPSPCPQPQFTFNWSFNLQHQENQENQEDQENQENQEYGGYTNSPPETFNQQLFFPNGVEIIDQPPPLMMTTLGRRKRRRTKTCKNKVEVEIQRMTHIVVERNRRKQMNEYLSLLRSLMPTSYVQRGDQASIIGGAINYVKELEHHLYTLEGDKKTKQNPSENDFSSSSPFAKFFSFPQYSTQASDTKSWPENDTISVAIADIEVTLVEGHANVKILTKKRPKQLLKIVTGLQSLRLDILHLNGITCDQFSLFSLSLKIEEGCKLSMVDEIAAAVNQMLCQIEEESLMLN